MHCPRCRPKVKLINLVGNIWSCPECDYMTTDKMHYRNTGEKP